MPIVDDVLLGLQIQIDALWYNLLFSIAGIVWSVQRAFLMMGYVIELINQWLVDNAFTPLITQTNASLQVAVSVSFAVALLVLGVTYLLAAFARMRVVEPRSAIVWYIAAALFFTLGPSFYQGMNEFRRELSGAFYTSSLSGLQSATGSAFNSLNSVDSADLGLLQLCDNFGTYLPVWNPTVDGLDVALAYLRADSIDIMGYPSVPRDIACPVHPSDPVTGLWTAGNVPYEWRRPGSYFDNVRDPVFFPAMTAEERADSISMASSAQGRLLTAWPLILFGVAEQLVYLLLTIAQGLTFMSFGIAILFAFFKKTEVIARSIIDLWIELIIQTVIIALVQSLVVTFFLAGTASNNGVVVLGMGLICLIFMMIVLWSGVKAVWNSLNRLFNAFGQAAGGTVMSPGHAAAMATAGAVGTAVGLATGGAALVSGAVGLGSNALAGMTALQGGATPAQAAGLAFGGLQPLAGAARSLMFIPGVRGTSVGDAAEQFTEGAVTRRVASDVPLVGRVTGPMVGGMLLTDRDPDHGVYDDRGHLVARPMLVPAIGEGLEQWSTPLNRKRKHGLDDSDDFEVAEDGEVVPPSSGRSGIFTPHNAEQSSATHHERQTHADNIRGEELETHLTEQLGSLQIKGVDDISSVLADVIRLLDGNGSKGVEHLATAALLARAVGVHPADGDHAPVREDLTRFGLFVDLAARLGLNPELTERISRERQVTPETRQQIVGDYVQSGGNRALAELNVTRLENAVGLLPEHLTVHGIVSVPTTSFEVRTAENKADTSQSGD